MEPETLRRNMEGEVVAPEDVDWDSARRAWNLAVDQHPALVAVPKSTDDVKAVVEFAGDAGLRIAAQATGHNAGAMGPLSETILMRTVQMTGVDLDAEARTARVGAGALWGDLTVPASEAGLAPLAGSSPGVGIVGYCLGGGIGWLSRRYGLASSSVTAVELVTAAGEHVRADAENEGDLFWALRGGGGSFGAVTGIELELYETPELYAGMLLWPWERSAEVLEAYRTWAPGLPDEVTSDGRIMQFPPFEEIPEPLRGGQFVIVEAAYLGDEGSAGELLEPLRALEPQMDTFAPVAPAALAALHMDPPEPVPGLGDHRLLGELSPDAIDAMVGVVGPGSGSPLLSCELRQLGGALGRPAAEGGALSGLDAEYAMFAVGIAADEDTRTATATQLERVMEAFAPWDAGRGYLNFTERSTDSSSLFDTEAYARLRQVKTAYDPDDLFRANHPIPPG